MFKDITSNTQLKKVLISTGNILNVLDTTTAPLRKSNEELLDSLKLCAECIQDDDNSQIEDNDNVRRLLRASEELKQKITENARNEISIGAKLFLNRNSKEYVREAVTALMEVLNVDYLDNLILAYHPNDSSKDGTNTGTETTSASGSTAIALKDAFSHRLEEPFKTNPCNQQPNLNPDQELNEANPTTPTTISAALSLPLLPMSHSVIVPDGLKWSSRNGDHVLHHLKKLWNCLEDFAFLKKINQLGISDLDIEALAALCESARVEPAIAQINQSNCCIVPNALKDFCAQHEIQLLTHNDPEILMQDDSFILPGYSVAWSLRYQVHVRCRGVLTAKGYLISALKNQEPLLVNDEEQHQH